MEPSCVRPSSDLLSTTEPMRCARPGPQKGPVNARHDIEIRASGSALPRPHQTIPQSVKEEIINDDEQRGAFSQKKKKKKKKSAFSAARCRCSQPSLISTLWYGRNSPRHMPATLAGACTVRLRLVLVGRGSARNCRQRCSTPTARAENPLTTLSRIFASAERVLARQEAREVLFGSFTFSVISSN